MLSRKQREIRDREARVLNAARALLLEGGYHRLTMARVAEAVEYSKGTIYQHFSCKENIIAALATQSVEKQFEFVERAAAFRGRPRERFLAIGEAAALYGQLYEEDSRIFQIMTGEAVLRKASPEALWRLKTTAQRTLQVMLSIIQDAVSHGDLKLPAGTSAEEMVFPFWVLGEGGKAAASNWFKPEEFGVRDPFSTIIRQGQIFADGYGWRPLSTEWDYGKTMRRIREEVLPAEYRKASGEG